MHDGDFLVDILDKDGAIVGQKLRKDIVKGKDIYHAVYCVLITPEGELALNKIAERQDMPNLHAGSFGCTAATIKRNGESGDEAMKRALKNELHIDGEPALVSEEVIEVDNTYRKIGLYTVTADVPADYNREDIEEIVCVTLQEFESLLEENSEKITPLLRRFWDIYSRN